MNLQPINPPRDLRMPCACADCGGEVNCSSGWADLDGAPFKAYVCGDCAAVNHNKDWHIALNGPRVCVTGPR